MTPDWKTRLDARIDRCPCGRWRWDSACAACDKPVETPVEKEPA